MYQLEVPGPRNEQLLPAAMHECEPISHAHQALRSQVQPKGFESMRRVGLSQEVNNYNYNQYLRKR